MFPHLKKIFKIIKDKWKRCVRFGGVYVAGFSRRYSGIWRKNWGKSWNVRTFSSATKPCGRYWHSDCMLVGIGQCEVRIPMGASGFSLHPNVRRVWDPPRLVFNVYWSHSPGGKPWGLNLTTQLSPVSRLSMSRVKLLFHLYAFMAGTGTALPSLLYVTHTGVLISP